MAKRLLPALVVVEGRRGDRPPPPPSGRRRRARHVTSAATSASRRDPVAGVDGAGLDNTGVDAAEVERSAFGGVHPAGGVVAEAGGELGAAGVRARGDLEEGVADRERVPGREVREAEVEVDVELVAGERPAAR